jgi:hypothetical protein
MAAALTACGSTDSAQPVAAASASGTATAAASTSAAPTSVAPPAPAPIETAGIPTSQRRTFVPTLLRLPSGAQVPVDPAGVDGGGVLAVPADIGRAGWWTGGAKAADPFGGVVIAGHVDSAEAGIGVMAELVDVKMGSDVVLQGSGERRVYRITSRKQVPKARLSADLGVFDQVVPERLVLITCGGRFDPVARHYADNLVVIAEPRVS